MKCTFCNKNSIASGGFYHSDGTKTPMESCDDHIQLMLNKQRNLVMIEDFEIRSKRLQQTFI
jgi:hypothetical protein